MELRFELPWMEKFAPWLNMPKVASDQSENMTKANLGFILAPFEPNIWIRAIPWYSGLQAVMLACIQTREQRERLVGKAHVRSQSRHNSIIVEVKIIERAGLDRSVTW
jgi:hypothetical protein